LFFLSVVVPFSMPLALPQQFSIVVSIKFAYRLQFFHKTILALALKMQLTTMASKTSLVPSILHLPSSTTHFS
jgi:hypothetical protein